MRRPTLRAWLLGLGGRLFLAAFATGLALAGAELALRLLVPAEIGTPTTDGDGFSFFAYDPELGWDLVPGTADRTRSDEFDVEVKINGQRMRSDREISPVALPGVRRLALIGDSFSFGQGVEVHEGFGERLAEALPNVELLNLAVTGYGTDQQLMKLEAQGWAFAPDLVLLGLFEGDVFRNDKLTQLGYPKPRYVLGENGRLVLDNVPVPRAPAAPGLLAGSRVAAIAGKPARSLVEHLGWGASWPVTEAILARLAAVCKERGVPLAVVVIPKDQAVLGSGLRRALHTRTLGLVGEMLDRLEVPYLDLTAALAAAIQSQPGTALYFPRDGHWTPAGHAVAAHALASWLPEASPEVKATP